LAHATELPIAAITASTAMRIRTRILVFSRLLCCSRRHRQEQITLPLKPCSHEYRVPGGHAAQAAVPKATTAIVAKINRRIACSPFHGLKFQQAMLSQPMRQK
jgi:hypothetical protein